MRVVPEIVNEIPPPDIEHRSQGDERGKAEQVPQAPVEDRGAESAALADERDVSGKGYGSRERGVEAVDRAHHPQAVRSDQPGFSPVQVSEDLSFQGGACLTGFLESGG